MPIETFALRLGLALLLGAVIGAERQWHQKMAGLRTNVLVSIGAASFVAMSDLVAQGSDPTRIAAQIVSGIGFLGAGMIMREGLTVHGLNTAATIWCSAAVGSLAGSGYLGEAAIGSIAIVIANAVLRPLGELMNRHLRAPAEGGVHYVVTLLATEAEGAALRTELLAQLGQARLGLQELKSTGTGAIGQVEITASLIAPRRHDEALEAIVGQLSLHAQVSDAKWRVANLVDAHG